MISEQGPGRSLHADETPTEIIQAISMERPDLPPRPPEVNLPTRTRERRQLKLSAALGAVILIVLGVAAYEIASGVGTKPHATAAVAASVPSQTSAVSTPVSPSVSPAGSPTTASISPSPSASSVAVVARTLKPAGVTAVGPDGAAGDDPGTAALVIGGGTSTAWQTEWYATPNFGGLQSGTGLLIDMGHTVTVTSVDVTLGPEAGTDLEVRAGNSSSVSSLSTAAAEYGAGGTVQLKLTAPAQARYVLIWITKLAPDGQGTYQAKVYNITVNGQG
jgi:hypothetical protein